MAEPAEPTVRIKDYEQLWFLCWQLAPDTELTEREALSRYEREWRWIDEGALSDNERALLRHLARTYRGGSTIMIYPAPWAPEAGRVALDVGYM